jgi:glycosyltransferase involved in cell wall biosynthesis
MTRGFEIYALLHHPVGFSARSGMGGLAEALGAHPVFYTNTWSRLEKISWTLAHGARRFGNWYSGSDLNELVPVWDEWRFLAAIPAGRPSIAHFLWADSACPKWPGLFHRKGARVIGTFHASVWRYRRALSRFRGFSRFDRVTAMSESQRPYLLEAGVPAERISVILHGVDAAFFRPGGRPPAGGPLRGLLVGSTERDHAFMAQVMRALPAGVLALSVLTCDAQKAHYRETPGVTLLAPLSDAQLLDAYRSADLFVIPMIDCTANNAMLEAMACGTPVLSNRVGGVPEYAGQDVSFILEDKSVDRWVDTIRDLAGRRDELEALRPRVRAWAERFDWPRVAPEYERVYRSALGLAPRA